MIALVIILGILFICSVITIVIFSVAIPNAVEYYATEMKTLSNGEVIIKTDEGQYFHALDEDCIPVLISEEEGERLWNLED